MASNQALELVAQYNEVSKNLSMAIQQVHKLRAEWDEWNGEETIYWRVPIPPFANPLVAERAFRTNEFWGLTRVSEVHGK